jgi:RNA polymerase sigma-70 factor (ECF subfamily)
MKTLPVSDVTNTLVSESALIDRIISGEKELYEILMRRNNQKLYRVIRSYFRIGADIEDIMQNTYLKAFEKLPQFSHQSLFSTWLIRIGINEALGALRKKGHTIGLRANDHVVDMYENNKILVMPDSGQLSPERKLIQQEAKILLEQAIDRLDEKYRTVYILKEIEEMHIAEIAECLGLTTANVKVRHHRAKLMIKEELYALTLHKEIFEFGAQRCDELVNKIIRVIS